MAGKPRRICNRGHDKDTTGRYGTHCKPCTDARRNTPAGIETRWKRQGIKLLYPEYLLLLDVQGGVCAVCEKASKLVPDHNHHTGEVRALLCNPCNTGIGMLADSADRLNRAAEYLDNHGN